MDVKYIYVDTCVLSDLLKQYDPQQPYNTFQTSKFITKKMVPLLNSIVSDEDQVKGYIISSIFAFVELFNKFESIFGNIGITKERIESFMIQPPSWFIVENLSIETAKQYCKVPLFAGNEAVSSDDAVHIATAMQRGDKITFLTTDHILRKLSIKNISFVDM